MENQLAIQLQKPEKCEACVVPAAPKETPRAASVDVVNANTKAMAKLLAMGAGLQPDEGVQLRAHGRAVGNLHRRAEQDLSPDHARRADRREARLPARDEQARRPWSCRRLGDFLAELDAIKEGDGTLLDNSLVMAFSDTGYAKIHSIENIPMFLAGGAGGRHKAGQHIAGKGEVGDARLADGDAARRRAGRRIRRRRDEDLAPDHAKSWREERSDEAHSCCSAGAAIAVALASAPHGRVDESYVVEWNEPAMYYGAKTGVIDPGTDCPNGTNPEIDWIKVLVDAGYTREEASGCAIRRTRRAVRSTARIRWRFAARTARTSM